MMRTDETLERHNVPYRHTAGLTESIWMGRPRLYATTVARKAAWRRRQGMAVRPHYPSAAAKQAAYRARKRQAAQDLAARECAAIQQALQTRALADQCWELYELIDAWSRDRDMPRRGAGGSRHAPSCAARSPSALGRPRRVYAGIAGRSSAGRTSGPPRKHTRARCAQRAQPEALEALEEVRVLSATLQEESKGLRAHAQRLREQSVTLCDCSARARERRGQRRGHPLRRSTTLSSPCARCAN